MPTRTDEARSRAALSTVAALGIALQLFQREDPTPLLRYFTIWSAAALCLYGSGILKRIRAVDSYVRTAGSAGAVFSAFVYLLIIAPVNGIGQEWLTMSANAVLHLAVPVVVVGLYARHPQWAIPPTAIVPTLAFPACYLVWAEISAALLGTAPVYLFLDVNQVGLPGVLTASIVGAGVYLLVAWLLSRIAGRGTR